jgi:hypothetical protein
MSGLTDLLSKENELGDCRKSMSALVLQRTRRVVDKGEHASGAVPLFFCYQGPSVGKPLLSF